MLNLSHRTLGESLVNPRSKRIEGDPVVLQITTRAPLPIRKEHEHYEKARRCCESVAEVVMPPAVQYSRAAAATLDPNGEAGRIFRWHVNGGGLFWLSMNRDFRKLSQALERQFDARRADISQAKTVNPVHMLPTSQRLPMWKEV